MYWRTCSSAEVCADRSVARAYFPAKCSVIPSGRARRNWPKDFGEAKHTLFREGSRTKFRDKPERHGKRSDACLDLCKKCLCARARYTAHAAAERLVFWVGSVQ